MPFYLWKDYQEICLTRARKVTLGVRIGGPGEFRSKENSIYFEFDPLPSGFRQYRVVRIADTPKFMQSSEAALKSIFVFDLHPSGMQVKIATPSQDLAGFVGLKKFNISGNFLFAVAPPQVARDSQRADDWFYFYQRNLVQPKAACSGQVNLATV